MRDNHIINEYNAQLILLHFIEALFFALKFLFLITTGIAINKYRTRQCGHHVYNAVNCIIYFSSTLGQSFSVINCCDCAMPIFGCELYSVICKYKKVYNKV